MSLELLDERKLPKACLIASRVDMDVVLLSLLRDSPVCSVLLNNGDSYPSDSMLPYCNKIETLSQCIQCLSQQHHNSLATQYLVASNKQHLINFEAPHINMIVCIKHSRTLLTRFTQTAYYLHNQHTNNTHSRTHARTHPHTHTRARAHTHTRTGINLSAYLDMLVS